jgi:cytochrome c-type biogenesis protein CcmH
MRIEKKNRLSITHHSLLITLYLVFALPFSALALEASEPLKDPALEKRAVELGNQLRCLVCEGESVNDSPARMARNLRGLVREKLSAGWNDPKILAHIQDRYGDYILFKPPLKPATWPLWAAPWLVLGTGLGLFALYLSRHNKKT